MAYASAFGFVMLVPRRPVHQAARRLSYTSSNISNHVVTYIKLQKRALNYSDRMHLSRSPKQQPSPQPPDDRGAGSRPRDGEA